MRSPRTAAGEGPPLSTTGETPRAATKTHAAKNNKKDPIFQPCITTLTFDKAGDEKV